MADNNNQQAPRIYEFDGYRLHPNRRRLHGPDGEPLVLRGKVFDLLLHLVESRGRVVEKTVLMEALWPNVVVDENNLNQAMTALRQALGEQAQSPKYIETITGRGYQFIGDVRVVENEAENKDAGTRIWPVALMLAVAVVVVLLSVWRNPAELPSEVTNAAVEQFQELSPRLVTDFHGSHSQPSLSPDGSMMAWLSDIDGMPQIWVGNLQVGDPIQITHGEFPARSPSWSPDNSQIIFERDGPRYPSIFSVDTLGTSPPRMLLEGGADPSFSRRTNEFVFTRGKQVWLAAGDGSNARKIENLPIEQGFADRMPALSPDGDLIAFVHAAAGPIGNLWVIGTDEGAVPRQLTEYDLESFQYVLSPVFSADGREIIYSLGDKNGTAGLWRIPVSGGEPQALTSGGGTFNSPDVSATGDRIAYTNKRPTSKLVVISPDSGEQQTIYESRHTVVLPSGSPGGSQIVFFSPFANGMQVMTIATDGRSLRQRTFNDGGANTLPIFGSDEDSIYYYENNRFVRQYLDEGRTETVFEDFHWSTNNWVAVFEDQVAYQKIDRTVRSQTALIRNLTDSSESVLPVKLEGMVWSRDGSEILGFVRNPERITICNADSLQCDEVTSLGEPVRAYLPRWSRDEQRIFFLRQTDAGDCCNLWVINRDGTELRYLTQLQYFDRNGSYFGVTEKDEIFYNFVDDQSDEIWLVAAD